MQVIYGILILNTDSQLISFILIDLFSMYMGM